MSDGDDAVVVDPAIALREKCSLRSDVAPLKAKLGECNRRVESRAGTAEICMEEMIDYVEALDRCVSKDLFKFLKTPPRLMSRLMSIAAAQDSLVVTFATPSQVHYENSRAVKQVDVPTVGSGEMGLLARHVPAIGVLKPGVVTFFETDGSVHKYFVCGGTMVMNADSSLQILAEEAARVDELDAEACRRELIEWQARLDGAKDDAAKVEARIALECAEAAVKAAVSAPTSDQ